MRIGRGAAGLGSVIALGVAVVACGGGSQVTPGASGAATVPATATAAPAASSTGAPGSGLATVSIGGAVTTIRGGSCGHAVLPSDFGGGYAFGINIGTPSFGGAGGPDYLGVLIDTPGPDPDGVYEMSWGAATGTLFAGGQDVSLGKIRLEVLNDGSSGVLTSTTRTDALPVIIQFTC